MGFFNKLKKKRAQDKERAELPYSIEDLLTIVDEVVDSIDTEQMMRIKITEDQPQFTQSKFGGVPYLSHDTEVPRDEQGIQLKLLAQINCEDLTMLEGFPSHGIIQFWFSASDIEEGEYPVDSDVRGKFKIIYYDSIDSSVTKEEVNKKINSDTKGSYSTGNGEFALTFSLETEKMGLYDYRFDPLFIQKFNERFPEHQIASFEDLPTAVSNEAFTDSLYERSEGHKIGGSPGFISIDPRDWSMAHYDVLLFQMDSDYAHGDIIELVGDNLGIANFFINKEALLRLDFSDVLCTWC